MDLKHWNSMRSAVRQRNQSAIVLISPFIGVVGLASVTGLETLREIVVRLGLRVPDSPETSVSGDRGR